MFRHVPNALTALRLVLAVAFFVLLSWYQYEGRGEPGFLALSCAIYILALVTDYLDGYLARLWKVESPFGRIVDPFVDKILVLGAFIFFAGKNFIIPQTVQTADGARMVVRTITGVAPGIVVILLARELLITTLRGMAESGGQAFGAVFAGKLKMGFQSGTILVILLYVSLHAWHFTPPWDLVARIVRDVGIWGTVAITLWSGWGYVQKAVTLYAGKSGEAQA